MERSKPDPVDQPIDDLLHFAGIVPKSNGSLPKSLWSPAGASRHPGRIGSHQSTIDSRSEIPQRQFGVVSLFCAVAPA
jgi:hypothetical protein